VALKSILLRCLAKSAVKNVANLLTFGVGGDLLTDFWDAWRQAQDADKRRAEIKRLASASPGEVRAAAAEIIREEGASLPAEQQRQLADWLTQTPAAIRRSLRRPSDPSGRTVAPGQAPTCARDLAALVPPRPPRFKAGDRPMPGVDLVLEELLGVGGFGEVWKARNPHLGSAAPVALKFCLDGQARQALQHESEMLDAVMRHGKHPGIVELRHTYLSADPPCLEYQFVQGGDLADLVRAWHRKGQATLERVAQVVLKLAGIVAFAHRWGIVHRDLKPANVLAEKGADGKVKLRVTDFGIGAVASRQEVDQAKRETQGTAHLATVARGAYTPLYASPQQMRGERADPRDDVYALGVIWYQALTGELSEGAPTGEAWKEGVRQKGMSEELLSVLVSCLGGKAEYRPASAHVLEERLRAALAPEAPETAEFGGPNRAKLGLFALAGVLLFVALLGGTLWLLDGGGKTEGDGKTEPVVKGWGQEVVNSIGMKLVRIPPGKFMMGSPKDEEGRGQHGVARPGQPPWVRSYEDNEGPVHEVEITKGFYMGQCEVTQKEYVEVMGYNPSHYSRSGRYKYTVPADARVSQFPVENVSWYEAQDFCAALSARLEEKRAGRQYRLPTEAEWEYACRGGSTTYHVFSFGKSLSSTQANFNGNYPYGGADKGQNLGRPCEVGSYKPNKFGLYDMHGNVCEWCSDWYDKDYYGRSPEKDPSGPAGGVLRMRRSGSFLSHAPRCRSADRQPAPPADPAGDAGFRVVLVLTGR
jgi:formylglycine-generating enzyme required for sulfatase activity